MGNGGAGRLDIAFKAATHHVALCPAPPLFPQLPGNHPRFHGPCPDQCASEPSLWGRGCWPLGSGACCFFFLKHSTFTLDDMYICVSACNFAHVSTVPMAARRGRCLSRLSSEKPEIKLSFVSHPLSKLSAHPVRFLELPCFS